MQLLRGGGVAFPLANVLDFYFIRCRRSAVQVTPQGLFTAIVL